MALIMGPDQDGVTITWPPSGRTTITTNMGLLMLIERLEQTVRVLKSDAHDVAGRWADPEAR